VRQLPVVSAAGDDADVLVFGPLTIDLGGLAVAVDGCDVPVTYSEFVLLKTLARAPYRVADRTALAAALRGAFPGNSSQPEDPRLIDRHIARLRKKLRAAGCDCIQTMRFAGYRFVPTAGEQTLPRSRRAG
jgi:DNA-binding response OmpR family regulator